MLEMIRALLALKEQFPDLHWEIQEGPVLDQLVITVVLSEERKQFLTDARRMFS